MVNFLDILSPSFLLFPALLGSARWSTPRSSSKATEPSVEPLSTTSSSISTPWARIESRQRGSSPSEFQLGMTTATVAISLTRPSLTAEYPAALARDGR